MFSVFSFTEKAISASRCTPSGANSSVTPLAWFYKDQGAPKFDLAAAKKTLADAGILPMKESVEQFQKRIATDHAKWREIVRIAGIKQE